MIQVIEINERGQTEDVIYTCGILCQEAALRDLLNNLEHPVETTRAATVVSGETTITWGGCPGGAETDYDVHCATCETLLWEGLS